MTQDFIRRSEPYRFGWRFTIAALLILGACSGPADARLDELEAELAALEEAARDRGPDQLEASSTTTTSIATKESVRDAPTSTTSTPTTSSTTTSTTLPNVASETSLTAFQELAEAANALDYSKQIETPCGLFGMTVLTDRIQLYQWDGASWFDQSDLLGPDGDLVPSWVKSHDFTGDGVLDMFVHYKDPYDNSLMGSLFWQRDCIWGWAPFLDEWGSREVVPGLSWNASRGDLQGSTQNFDGYTTYFLAKFDPSLNAFVFEDVPFSYPPYKCIEAVSQIARFNSSSFLESWWGSDRIYAREWWGRAGPPIATTESLESCRRNDWLTEVERWRSSYNNHTDAQYYGQDYVLLSNEVAANVLAELCSYEVWFYDYGEKPWRPEHEGWVPAFRSPESVACD